MDCRNVKKLLNDFLEGTLLEGVRGKINLHLEGCPQCQKEKELLSKTWQLLDVYTAPKLKEDFTSSLMKKIHLEQAELVKVTYRLPQVTFRRLAPVLTPLFILIIMFSFFANKPTYKKRLAALQKTTTPASAMHSAIPQREIIQEAASTITDQEIIQDLDILQNLELLDNINLLSDFDIVEDQETTIS